MSQRLVLGADPAWLVGMITTEFPSFPALFWSTNGLMDDQPHPFIPSHRAFTSIVPLWQRSFLVLMNKNGPAIPWASLESVYYLVTCIEIAQGQPASFATPGRELCNKWTKRKTYYRIEPTVSKHDKAHVSQLKKLLFEEWQQAHGNIFVTQATMKKLPYQTTKLQNQWKPMKTRGKETGSYACPIEKNAQLSRKLSDREPGSY